jgi:hypothetical protein
MPGQLVFNNYRDKKVVSVFVRFRAPASGCRSMIMSDGWGFQEVAAEVE